MSSNRTIRIERWEPCHDPDSGHHERRWGSLVLDVRPATAEPQTRWLWAAYHRNAASTGEEYAIVHGDSVNMELAKADVTEAVQKWLNAHLNAPWSGECTYTVYFDFRPGFDRSDWIINAEEALENAGEDLRHDWEPCGAGLMREHVTANEVAVIEEALRPVCTGVRLFITGEE